MAPPPGGAPTSYSDIRGTRLEELLRAGAFQVVRGQYFLDRHERRERIQMRQDIAPEYVWAGPEAADRWAEWGPLFLVAVSYAWLDKEHPDPDGFHLEKLAALVQEHLEQYARSGVGEVGIIFDYCCFSQKKLVDGVDSRTDAEKAQLKAGLEEINTVYGHQEIMAWRLEQVPDKVLRKYADRGWTLFESVIIDAKANPFLQPNIRTLTGVSDWVDQSKRRGPPLTPERFELELRRRGDKARAKGVPFFTNGKEDLPLVRRKYRDSFAQLTLATQLVYPDASAWGAQEASALLEALPRFRGLQELHVDNLLPEAGSALARGLAALLDAGACPALRQRPSAVGTEAGAEGGEEDELLRSAWRRREEEWEHHGGLEGFVAAAHAAEAQAAAESPAPVPAAAAPGEEPIGATGACPVDWEDQRARLSRLAAAMKELAAAVQELAQATARA